VVDDFVRSSENVTLKMIRGEKYLGLLVFAANKCSLEIDYKQFIFTYPNISIWLVDYQRSIPSHLSHKVVVELLRVRSHGF
jgi:hypothetical protein